MDSFTSTSGRTFFAARDGVQHPDGHATRRVRRIPRLQDSTVDANALRDACAIVEDVTQQRCPIVLSREYKEMAPSLLLGFEAFDAVDERFSTSSDDASSAQLAHASGPPLLSASAGGTVEHPTLVDALVHTARHAGRRGITYASSCGSVRESYANLLCEAERLLRGFWWLGLRPRQPVAMQLVETRAHIHALWACALGGLPTLTVAVAPQLTATNAVAAKLVAGTAQLDVRHVLASDDLAKPLQALLPNMEVVAFSRLGEAASREPRELPEPFTARPDDVLFFQLTSGSTGVPKVIPETHRAVITHIRHAAQCCNARPSEETSLNWLPLDHVVPMLTFHFADVYLGRAAVQLPTDEVIADPLLWLRAMAAERVTHSWAPNFGFKLVVAALRAAGDTAIAAVGDLSCIRQLMNAGEQVTADVCDAFLALTTLAPAVMLPAFGMAETATCMTYAGGYGGAGSRIHVRKESFGALSCQVVPPTELALGASTSSFVDLGAPSPGVEIRIVAPAAHGSDSGVVVLRERQVGRLQIRGACVMDGYVNNPAANAECLAGEGWLDSGDLGFLHNGRLVLTGRAKEVLIVRGANFHCYEIEDVVGALPGVATARVGATSVRDARLGTEVLVLIFVPSAPLAVAALPHLHEDGVLIDALRRLLVAVRSTVVSAFGLAPRYVIPVPESSFHRTTSGKIMRGALRAAFLRGEYQRACTAHDLTIDNVSELAFPDFFAARVWAPKPPERPRNARSRRILLLAAPHLLVPLAEALERTGELTGSAGCTDWREIRSLLFKLQPTHVVHALFLTEHLPSDAGSDGMALNTESDAIARDAGRACATLLDVGRALSSWLGSTRATAPPPRPTLLCWRFHANTGAPHTVAYEAGGAAMASSVCKALAAELPSLARTAAVSVPVGSSAAWIADVMLSETAVDCALDMDVEYDADGMRSVQRYRSVGAELQRCLRQQCGSATVLRPSGTYIVSGGLGGIGVEVVRLLLADEACHGCSVLILGRRSVEQGTRRLAELGLGARVTYASIELGDGYEALRVSVLDYLAQSGRALAAVFHLAGSYSRVAVADLTASELTEAARGKVWGAIHLHRVAEEAGSHPAFIHFGTVATVYSGTGLATYAAANAFLAWFARWQRDTAGLDARTIDWASWAGVGISDRDETLGMASWLSHLPIDLGMRALRRLLDVPPGPHGPHDVLVGVEWRDAELGCLFCDGPVALTTPCLFYSPEQCPERALCAGRVPLCVPKLPTCDAGRVDLHALRTRPLRELLGMPPLRIAGGEAASTLPADASQLSTATGVVALVVETVRDVCATPIDADGDLFAAGLSSLTAARLRGALQKRLGLELPSRLLLELPNVRALSASLFARLRAAAGDDPADEAAGTAAVEDPALAAIRAMALLREGDVAAAEELVRRAADSTGLPLDLAGLRALLADVAAGASPSPRLQKMASLLKSASVAWACRGEHAHVAVAQELLLLAHGTAHGDAPVLALGLAFARSRLGHAAEAAKALEICRAPVHRYGIEGDAAAREHEAHAAPPLVLERIAIAAAFTAPSAKTLVSLTLSRLRMDALPDALYAIRRLQRLDVSHNRLVALPEAMEQLRGLRELHASDNRLASLPEALTLLPQLVILTLQSNDLRTVPDVALRCRRLRELKWGAQRVLCGHIEGGVQASTQLVLLELEATGATRIPELNPRNAFLGAVLASFNRLAALPPSLVRRNRPASCAQLHVDIARTPMRRLLRSHRRLIHTAVPSACRQRNYATSLKKLHLGCNEIVCVADVLPSLVQLTELCLEGNRLSALPAGIGQLTRLRELWVHGNALASLPEALGRCASLTVLQAHHNVLRELPMALAALERMQGLYLQSNQLSNLRDLREGILARMPLQNLALGANCFDLADAFELPDCRVGVGWNRGALPPHLPTLTDRFAGADHVFEPASTAMVGELLLVAFAAQGPGMQQWHAPAAALRAAGLQLDALYVADPSNSFYLQDPDGRWEGLRHFDTLIRSFAARYAGRVLMVGSSMGATAALQHAGLAARAISFAPRVDLALSHGAFVPPAVRAASFRATADALAASLARTITVHVGNGNHVDMAQVGSIPRAPSVYVVEHDTFHHNVPAHLEAQGELVPLLKAEALIMLRSDLGATLGVVRP